MPNKAKFCPDCGAQLDETVRFCPDCGAGIEEGEVRSAAPIQQMPPPPVMTQPMPPVTQPPPQAGAQFVAPPPGQVGQPPGGFDAPGAGYPPLPQSRRGKTGLIVGILGGVVVVAGIVLLILFLTVFKGGGGGGTNEPTALVNKYMDSLQNKNATAYMDCFQEDFFSNAGSFMEDLNMDPKKMVELALSFADFKFSGVQLEVQSQTADSATVVTTAGKATASVMGFDTDTDLANEPLEFDMIKEGGRWYLTNDPMDSSIDFSGDSSSNDYSPDFNSEDWLNQ